MRVVEVYSLTKKTLASQHKRTCVVKVHYNSQIRRSTIQTVGKSIIIDPLPHLSACKIKKERDRNTRNTGRD